MTIAYIVLVIMVCVTLNDYSEYVFDGILMTKEGISGNRYPSAHVSIEPLSIYLTERNLASAVDNVHQPNVLFEERIRFHDRQKYCKSRTNHTI